MPSKDRELDYAAFRGKQASNICIPHALRDFQEKEGRASCGPNQALAREGFERSQSGILLFKVCSAPWGIEEHNVCSQSLQNVAAVALDELDCGLNFVERSVVPSHR
jgi:hypothetical protein